MIEIIVVSYFSSTDLERFVASLRRQDHDEWRLTVVDNSCDEAEHSRISLLVQSEPRLRLAEGNLNSGYFGGARFALKTVDTSAADMVVISNADIEFPHVDTLSSLLCYQRTLPSNVGILAPRVTSSRNGRDQNPHLVLRPRIHEQRRRMRRMSNLVAAQLTVLGSTAKQSLWRIWKQPSAAQAGAIYAAHGSFLVFLNEYFRRGGDFQHPLFLFAEELTVAEKARALNLRTLYVPDVEVKHVEHGQMGVLRSRSILRAMVQAAKYGFNLISDANSTEKGNG